MSYLSRRDLLGRMGSGLGFMAMASLLKADGLLADGTTKIEWKIEPEIEPGQPHAPRPPHFEPRAKNVVVIFCSGALGHVDSFDNPKGFTAILAGAGVRAPSTYGATDEFGWKAQVDPVSVHDFHATILHLLGLNHTRLTYYHNGLERRLTDVHGQVVEGILAP